MNMELLNRKPSVINMLCCPSCNSDLASRGTAALVCGKCCAIYPIVDGIIDLFPEYEGSKKFLQWAMERKAVVGIYEDFFRPTFTKFFSKSHVTYDGEVAWLNNVLPAEIRHALDLAAGTGRYTEIISSIRAPELVVTIDVSVPMLVAAKKRNESRGIHDVLYIRADAHSVPLKNGSVDTILCFGAMHLFENPSAVIRECARVLQMGGTFSALTAGSINGHELRMALLSKLLGWIFFDKSWLTRQFEEESMSITAHSQSNYVAMFSASKR